MPVYNLVEAQLLVVRRVDLLREFLELLLRCLRIQGLVRILSEYFREVLRHQTAEDQVGVCNSKRASFAVESVSNILNRTNGANVPVARRARLCTRTLWTCAEQAILEGQARSSSGGDRVDIQLRRLNRHTCRRRLVHDLVPPVEARDIGRRSADIKANNGVLALRVPARERVTDDTARRPGEDALQSGEVVQVDEATIGAHELDARTLHATVAELLVETAEEAVEILAEDGRKVRIGRRRDAARDHLDHGEELGGEGDLREADRFRDIANRKLMLWISVRVAEDDRE